MPLPGSVAMGPVRTEQSLAIEPTNSTSHPTASRHQLATGWQHHRNRAQATQKQRPPTGVAAQEQVMMRKALQGNGLDASTDILGGYMFRVCPGACAQVLIPRGVQTTRGGPQRRPLSFRYPPESVHSITRQLSLWRSLRPCERLGRHGGRVGGTMRPGGLWVAWTKGVDRWMTT